MTRTARPPTFPRVKNKPLLPLVFALLAALAFAPAASAGWFGGGKARPHVPPAAMGNDTFSIVIQAKNGFDRDLDRMRAEAREDAEFYCANHGKKLRIVTVSDEKPFFSLGYASVKLVFQAVDANAPELAAAPAPVASPTGLPASSATYTQTESAPAPTYAPSYPASTGGFDLYTELNKLDDLRKRGLLTDKEFEKEKKKLLKRSK